MDLRTRLTALVGLLGYGLLWVDAYLAACLDRRPLMRTAERFAAWLGRTWRRAAADAHTRRHGPGRGVIAIVINRPRTEETDTDV